MVLNSRLLKVALVILTCAVTTTYAQQKPRQFPGGYPAKPIRVLIGSSPGGGLDTVTRIVARKLSERLGQSVIVDNRPGATSMIAMDLAAVATPDGYTLMSATNAIILHSVLKKVSYDILRAYAPLAKMTTQMYMLVVIPSLPIKSVKELIAYAKSNPDALNYGSSGIGSIQHVSMERFKLMASVSMVHVPYKGGGAAHLDLLSGRIQVMAPTVISVSAALKSGKLRAIAVTGAHRMQVYPDLPTVSESGVPGFESINMYGLFAPAGTPPAIMFALNREVSQAMTLPEMKNALAADGVDAAEPSTPEEFRDYFTKEFNQWEKFFKESKLKL